MGDSDEFGLYIHHGGKFVNLGAGRLYSGGELQGRFGLDKDRFGYLDLEEEIQKLGYTSWRCLAYKVPRTLVFMDLREDKEVMQMIRCVTSSIKSISVYVDDGKKGKVGKVKAVTETVTKTITKTVTTTKSSCGKGKQKVLHRKEPVEVVEEQNLEKKKGKGKENVQKIGTPILMLEELYDTDEDDDDYVPQHNEEEHVESDDSLGDKELGSGDEEYEEARTNIRESIGVIGDMEGVKETEEDRLSEYGDSDREGSDSSDSDGQVVRSKQCKAVYDPRGDISEFKLVLGMRFEDGFQCKKALISWSIVKGHPIHFRRVNKDQCEAFCEDPCPWRVYASMVKKERSLVVKVLGQDHTCSFAVGNKQASYKWIGEEYTEVFRVRPQMCIEEFRNDVKRRFNIAIPNGRLYRAKAHSLQLLRGTVQGHYNKLRSYILELMRVDREGRFELLCGDGTIFQRLYIGFSALKRGFLEGCRPDQLLVLTGVS